MSDLKKYVARRKARDPEFAENYEGGYLEFKIGVPPQTGSGRGWPDPRRGGTKTRYPEICYFKNRKTTPRILGCQR